MANLDLQDATLLESLMPIIQREPDHRMQMFNFSIKSALNENLRMNHSCNLTICEY